MMTTTKLLSRQLSSVTLAILTYILSTGSVCQIRGESALAEKRIVVWDGEQANIGAGWVNPTTSTIKPQSAESHSGNTALEFKFKGSNQWLGAGWNWCAFKTGPHGADITSMKYFTFWIKKKGKVADLQINLLCNGKVFDMPEHHTEKVSVLKYCPQLLDGEWHQVRIPLTNFKQPMGFDRTVWKNLK